MTDLSPATEAMLDAVCLSVYDAPAAGCPNLVAELAPHLATALRALARHQHPAWAGDGPLCHWTPTPHTRQELRNIATELEALPTHSEIGTLQA